MTDLMLYYLAGDSTEGPYQYDSEGSISGACVDTSGNVNIAKRSLYLIYQLPADESVATVFAGVSGERGLTPDTIEGLPPTEANFFSLIGCDFSSSGTMYINDNNNIYKISDGVMVRVMGSGAGTRRRLQIYEPSDPETGNFVNSTDFYVQRAAYFDVISDDDEMHISDSSMNQVISSLLINPTSKPTSEPTFVPSILPTTAGDGGDSGDGSGGVSEGTGGGKFEFSDGGIAACVVGGIFWLAFIIFAVYYCFLGGKDALAGDKKETAQR